MKVKECMTQPIVGITPECTILEAAKKMAENHVGSLIVCNTGEPILGIVTDRDIVLRWLGKGNHEENTPVSQVMTRSVVVADADEDIDTVMNLMAENQVRRIPVTTNCEPVGIVSLGDLAQCQAISVGKQAEILEQICQCGCQNIRHAE